MYYKNNNLKIKLLLSEYFYTNIKQINNTTSLGIKALVLVYL
jgi:hypothetical protein